MAASTSSPRLTILGGPRAGQELTLDEAVDNILVGSDPSCRFHIDAPGVSPIHVRLWVDWQGLTVYDTGAPEGVYLNDDRVERSAQVHNGDILWLGPPGGEDVVMIQCRVPPRPAAAPPGVTPDLPGTDATDATTTVITPPADEALGFTDTVAFTTDDATAQPAPDDEAVGAAETVWITPGAAYQDDATTAVPAHAEVEPPSEPEPEAAAAEPIFDEEPFVAPGEPEAETVVLHTEALPATGFALADETAESAEEPVKFEIDEPPEALVSRPTVFEEDIDESAAAAEEPVAAEEPPSEPPETLVLAPPDRPAPRPATPPAAPAPRPATRPAAPRPAPPTKAAQPAPARRAAARSSSSGRYPALAAVALIVLGVGGFAAYRFLLAPPPPAATPVPSEALPAAPVTLAQGPEPVESEAPTPEPSVPVEEAVTIVSTPPPAVGAAPPTPTPAPKATPTPKPTPARAGPTPAPTPPPEVPREQQVAAQVAALVAQGDGALGEQRYDAAAAAYAQALQLDPRNAQASAGRARAQAAAAAARRTFVSGRSQLVGAKSGKKGPAGFEDEDVQVAKAPDYSGRLEFEASPRSVKPGDSYSVRVFLVNDGKKDFKIAAFSAVTSANGEKSGGPAAPATREVPTQQRALVGELTGVWKDGTTAWSVEAAVTSSHGEVVRNTLTWK